MACIYTLQGDNNETLVFDSKEALIKHVRTTNYLEDRGRKPSDSTGSLKAVLRQFVLGQLNYTPTALFNHQIEMLDKFVKLEEESKYFYKLGPIISLTKGLGKSYDSIDTVQRNLEDLGVGSSQLAKDIPFDVRYLITGNPIYRKTEDQYYHKITANNVRIMNEVDALSRTMFMERTPAYLNVVTKVTANLRENVANSQEKTKKIKDDFSAFAQLAAYKKWIGITKRISKTLRNSLIYDSNAPSIVDIVKKATELAPDNAFLKYILPVSTIVKTGKKLVTNINNKDLINTIEGRTRGKIEPDQIASLMDSFTELYLDPKTTEAAQALFDYLIVKDGLMYKNNSFIKMVPTLMFEQVSQATDMATRTMAANTIEEYNRLIKEFDKLPISDPISGEAIRYFSSEELQRFSQLFKTKDVIGVRNTLYSKVFGLDYGNLYNEFEKIYMTDVAYQRNIDIMKTVISTKRGRVTPDGISITADKGKSIINVTMFSPAFNATEKNTPQRSAAFHKTMEELAEAGFGVVKRNEDKSDLLFKKYIRVPREGKNQGYILARLSSVTRDKLKYTGADMTVEGEYIPSGTSAVYETTDPVGTSNTSGVVNLGPRPSKADLAAAIQAKLKQGAKATITTQIKAAVEVAKKSVTSSGIIFQQDIGGYKERTIKNASADATIAIAVDFNSAGEKLTKNSVIAQKKKYIPVDGKNLQVTENRVNIIVDQLNSVPNSLYGISLNIAGNGIYTMKGIYTQQQIDDFTYNLLNAVLKSPRLSVKITSIRTGGQTGFDESGAKAGIRLGIPTTVLAPKGWLFRDINGRDIANEQQFKARFMDLSGPVAPSTPTPLTVSPEDSIFGNMEVFDPSELGFTSYSDEDINNLPCD